jgi:hypothetical protein
MWIKRALLALLLVPLLAVATIHVNDGGTWRQVTEVHVNDAGTWRRIQEVWVNDGGTWRQVFVGDQININNENIFASAGDPNPATAGYQIRGDGDIIETVNASSIDIGDWITPKVNMANYQVRATLNSGGPLTASSATGVWLSSGVWLVNQSGVGSRGANLTIEIRRAADGVVLDSATVTLSATVSL